MTLLRWAPRSLRDIHRIEVWLDAIDPRLVGRIVAAIEDKADRLLDFPRSGPPIGSGRYRKSAVPRFGYVMVYRVGDCVGEIARVRYAHEDWLPR